MSTSVASVTKHFPSAENGFTTTTSGSVSSGATTVGLNSVAGYSNGEVAVFVIDPTDANKKQTFTGTIDTSGVQVTGVVWTAGTNQSHALGATVVDYATATHISMVTKGLLVEHNQTGTHSNVTATTVATTGKVTAGSSLEMTAGTLTLPSASINQSALPLGTVVQQVSALYSAVATGTGTGNIIPNDDTIPQNTEGTEFMSLAITPKSSSNILVIESSAHLACANATQIITTALFQDSTANALAVATEFSGASTDVPFNVPLCHTITAGTTSSTTFKIRGGSHQSTTTTFNGVSGGRKYGAIPKSSITITEYKA